MSYIRIDFYELDWAKYRGGDDFTGSNDGLIELLKYARFNVGPADGNAFAAMAVFLEKQNYKGIRISYRVTEIPKADMEYDAPLIIY